MWNGSGLIYAEDGHCKSGWPPRGHYWGLGQCLCAEFQKPCGEITSSGSTAQMHTLVIFKDAFLWPSLSNILCATSMLHMMVKKENPAEVWFTQQGKVLNNWMPRGRNCTTGDFEDRFVCVFCGADSPVNVVDLSWPVNSSWQMSRITFSWNIDYGCWIS